MIGLSQDERDTAVRVLQEDYNLCGDDTGCLCEESTKRAEEMIDKIVNAVNGIDLRPSTPDGWFPLGSHLDQPWIELEFSDEVDESGVALWERLVPPYTGGRV